MTARKAPAGCDQCGRYQARDWPDTYPAAYAASEYKPMPAVVPCSTLARLYLAWRRFWLG